MARRRDEELLRQIKDKFREIRKSRALTQDAVREDTNVDIAHFESKGTNLTITTIAILCNYYEITLRDFFDGITPSEDLNEWE